MPTVLVTRPLEWTLMRAPREPPDTLNPLGVTVMRTPGMTLNDFRALKPIRAPLGDMAVHLDRKAAMVEPSQEPKLLREWQGRTLPQHWGFGRGEMHEGAFD